MNILIPILAVAVIGLICGVGLSVASAVMKVEEDERLPLVRECLPGANCGACGFSGCDGYAAALLNPETKINLCVPGGSSTVEQLGEVLGVKAEVAEAKVAVVKCSGTCEATSPREEYHGIRTCKAAKLYFGGGGSCIFGCIGFGDCAEVCPNDAIYYNNGVAAVNPEKCTGCGLCAKECPQKVISVMPAASKVGVFCSSPEKGAVTRKACTAGCIGCKKCEKTCEHGAITVTDNLAKIDYSKCTGCGACVSACPAGCLKLREQAA